MRSWISARRCASRVLDGNPAAVGELASSFTHDWFCRRARKRDLGELNADEIVRILGVIARKTDGKGEILSYREHWLVPASSCVGDPLARRLYSAARSAGYINEIETFRWRWRHRLCMPYLSSTQ